MIATGNSYNMDFLIDPEGTGNSGEQIITISRDMEEKINNIGESLKRLDSWHSKRKDEFVETVRSDLTKMLELVKSISSFGSVAKYAGDRILMAESEIKGQLNG